MFGGFDREQILSFIVQMAEAQYDTISNLQQMTLQELSDVHKVMTNIQHERELAKQHKNKGRGFS